ncbi:hypothetical protein VTO73DRAFT_12516 [Trametes versicolor]
MQFPHPFTTPYPFYASPFVPSPYTSAGNAENQPSVSLTPYSNFSAVQSGLPTAVTFLIPPGASTINFTWRAENPASTIPPQLPFTSPPSTTHVSPRNQQEHPGPDSEEHDSIIRNTLGPSPSDAGSPGPEQTPQPKKRRKTYFSTELLKRKINNIDNEYTQWYESDADHKRRAPLERICDLVDQRTRTGRLYVHTHALGVQAWMWAYERGPDGVKPEGARKEWVEVQVGAAHPRLRGYVLHFLGNGEPRWVKAHSAVTYSIRRRASGAGDDDDYQE